VNDLWEIINNFRKHFVSIAVKVMHKCDFSKTYAHTKLYVFSTALPEAALEPAAAAAAAARSSRSIDSVLVRTEPECIAT
jgi:hypothetical protein